MNAGKILFARIMDLLPWTTFARYVQRYGGDRGVRTLLAIRQYARLGAAFSRYPANHGHRQLATVAGVQSAVLATARGCAIGARQGPTHSADRATGGRCGQDPGVDR
jgi:hypothetical protein